MNTIKHSAGAILFVLILWGSVAIFRQRPDLPSDKSLIKNFQKHRADFERLATMVNESRDIEGMIAGQVWPPDHQIVLGVYEGGCRRKRLSNYTLLHSSRTDHHFLNKRDNGLFLFIDVDWLPPDESGESNGVEKGYVYSQVDPGPLVESLDELGFEDKGRLYQGSFYKRIDEHWYLYFESHWTHGE